MLPRKTCVAEVLVLAEVEDRMDFFHNRRKLTSRFDWLDARSAE